MNTSLITTENKTNFTTAELSILDAKQNSPMILNASRYDLDRVVVNVLQKAYLDSGIQLRSEDAKIQISIVQLAKSVKEDLIKYFRTITIKEFEIAVENGIRKEYGDYYGINVSTIHQFVKAYKQSFDREEALRKQKLSYQEEEVKPTPDQVKAIMDQACLKSFETYKSTGALVDFGGAKYQHLEQSGIINLTIERKKEIFEQAKKETVSAASVDLYKKSSLSQTAEILKSIIKNPDQNEIVKNQARLISLKKFFDDLIETETELTDLIDK